ncbi:hypothetical protein [Solidesulfovibrio sp.]
MSFFLLDALRDHLTEAVASLPLLDPASRGREARFCPPRVLIGELPPRNKENGPAADDGGYPFILLRGLSGEDREEFSTCEVSIVCAVAAEERGEALEHEIQNLVAWVRTALLKRRRLGGRHELIPDKQERLLTWSIYPEFAHPYVAAQIQGTWKLPGIQLTEESYA